jgi:multiple sugar transport system substrate-binding protein
MLNENKRRKDLSEYLLKRRQVLKGTVAGAAALAVPGLFNQAQAKDPLHFVGWQYHPEIVEENVGHFKRIYNEPVNYELVPGEYHAVVETKLISGQHIDMMYSEEDRIARWNSAGWTRDLEGLPGLDKIKEGMYDVNIGNMSLPNGKLAGLPYYSGFNSFVCNEKHLSKAKLDPPSTWDEFMDQCRKLKRDKISNYPYISAWAKGWPTLSWSLFAAWYSEGAKVFTNDFDPDLDQNFENILKDAPRFVQRRTGLTRYHDTTRRGGSCIFIRGAYLYDCT